MNRTTSSLVCCFLTVFVLFAATAPQCQAKPPKGTIDKITISTDVRSPEYNAARRNSSQQWTKIEIEFETEGGSNGWADEIEFAWTVLLRQNSRFMMMRKTFSHLDVESGEKHHAVVYIRPSFLKRWYGSDRVRKSDIAVNVELRAEGEKLDRKEENNVSGIPKNWYNANEGNSLKIFENALLSRDETPFAPIEYDYYGHIKPKSR